MTKVTVREAKESLSRLLRRVRAGEEVVIFRSARPVAKIVAFTGQSISSLRGDLRGKIRIAPDFDVTPEDFRRYT